MATGLHTHDRQAVGPRVAGLRLGLADGLAAGDRRAGVVFKDVPCIGAHHKKGVVARNLCGSAVAVVGPVSRAPTRVRRWAEPPQSREGRGRERTSCTLSVITLGSRLTMIVPIAPASRQWSCWQGPERPSQLPPCARPSHHSPWSGKSSRRGPPGYPESQSPCRRATGGRRASSRTTQYLPATASGLTRGSQAQVRSSAVSLVELVGPGETESVALRRARAAAESHHSPEAEAQAALDEGHLVAGPGETVSRRPAPAHGRRGSSLTWSTFRMLFTPFN